MSQTEVRDLMRSSTNKDEWNANCDKVKAAFGGFYPEFLYNVVVLGGCLEYAKSIHGW